MNYIAFDFTTSTAGQSEQLVALLSELNFNGFEESDNHLKAFIAEEIFNEEEWAAVLQLFPLLPYTKSIVENINWNQQWENSFEPVLVNDFMGIRAGFHQPITNVQYEIIITPKMSFGTGHHATTHMMVEQMQGIDFAGTNVLDFGTGTGILAILAEKLGATKVFAIDNDEWSITNAKENIQLNNCTKIIIEQHDAIFQNDKYDVILANINLNVITANLEAIKLVAIPTAKILLSGFLKENEQELLESIALNGFNYISTIQKGQWIAIQIINKQ